MKKLLTVLLTIMLAITAQGQYMLYRLGNVYYHNGSAYIKLDTTLARLIGINYKISYSDTTTKIATRKYVADHAGAADTSKVVTKYDLFNWNIKQDVFFSSHNQHNSIQLTDSYVGFQTSQGLTNVICYDTPKIDLLLGNNLGNGYSIILSGMSAKKNHAQSNSSNLRWIPDKNYIDSTSSAIVGVDTVGSTPLKKGAIFVDNSGNVYISKNTSRGGWVKLNYILPFAIFFRRKYLKSKIS